MKISDLLCSVIRLRLFCLGIGSTVLGVAGIISLSGFTHAPFAAAPARVGPSQSKNKHDDGKVHYDLLAKLLEEDRRGSASDAWLSELADPRAPCHSETQTHPLLDRPAPDFTLSDHRGQLWTLSQHLAQGPVVVVFYYGYRCTACVHDLFELNADLERFRRLGAQAVAISADPSEYTKSRFEQYGGFGFPVLCDPGHAVAQCYGTFRPQAGSQPEELLHGTFVVGRDGKVHWANSGDAPFRNNKALLYALARLDKELLPLEPVPHARKTEVTTP
jgi:peroxiredoxin